MPYIEEQRFFDVEPALESLVTSLKEALNGEAQAIEKAREDARDLGKKIGRIKTGRKYRLSNKLINSYVVRNAIIQACVEGLDKLGSIPKAKTGNLDLLEKAFEGYMGVKIIQQGAKELAESGQYHDILSLLERASEWYYLDKSRPISDPLTYCRIYEGAILENEKHDKLLLNILTNLDRLNITPNIIPKSPYHIFREVRLTGHIRGDMDIVILSDSGEWFSIEATTKRRYKTSQAEVRWKLQKAYTFFKERFGINLRLMEVYGVKAKNEFDSSLYRCISEK